MMSSPKGRSLELYFVDGKPDGILIAEVFNWTGHILLTPRLQLAEALKRKEASYTGVYLLMGEKEGEPMLYIGEAENIAKRIRQHTIDWDTAVFITTTANNLNKAHVQYLEARLIEVARNRKISLENSTNPKSMGLKEAAQNNMETFLEYIFMVLPALQIDVFVEKTRPSPDETPSDAPQETMLFELQTPRHGIHAIASLQEDGEFVVQEGSLAREAWTGKGSRNIGYAQLHAELVRKGILAEQPASKLLVFTANYKFDSPSAAASVINGRPANGMTEWKVKGQSLTYKDWESQQLSASAPEDEA